MLESRVSYFGLILTAAHTDKEACADLRQICQILNKNKVLVGGYELEEQEPIIEDDGKYLTLDLGR